MPIPLESKHIYTVSQVTQEIGVIFENTFGNGVWVEGEI
jgi:exonuclease VII large subunit